MADRTLFLLGEDATSWSILLPLLTALPDWRVLDTATSIDQVPTELRGRSPYLLIATTLTGDTALVPLLTGLRQTFWPACPVLVLAPHFTPDSFVAFLNAGANGFLLWSRFPPEELSSFLFTLSRGRLIYDTAIAPAVAPLWKGVSQLDAATVEAAAESRQRDWQGHLARRDSAGE